MQIKPGFSWAWPRCTMCRGCSWPAAAWMPLGSSGEWRAAVPAAMELLCSTVQRWITPLGAYLSHFCVLGVTHSSLWWGEPTWVLGELSELGPRTPLPVPDHLEPDTGVLMWEMLTSAELWWNGEAEKQTVLSERVCVWFLCGATSQSTGPVLCVQPAINWKSCKYHLYNCVYSMCAFLSSAKCHFKTQRTGRKEISTIVPRKVEKGIVGEHFLFYLFLLWIKYTNPEHLWPLTHGSSVDLKTLLWIFFKCVCLGTVSIGFFSIISSCSLCSVTRCMAAPVRCFLNTKCHSLSTPNNPNWLSILAAWQALHTMLSSGKHSQTFANLCCNLLSLKLI